MKRCGISQQQLLLLVGGRNVRKIIFDWLGREFISLSGEGRKGINPAEEIQELLKCFEAELKGMSLSFDNTVRTRLWGRDSESRRLGSAQRGKVLMGRARSSSSSFFAPNYFDSQAHVALDLIATKPSGAGIEKILREYDPPVAPLRFLIYDSIIFLSGVTAIGPSLDDQISKIINTISDSLFEAGSSWDKVVKASFFLHSSQDYNKLTEHFQRKVKAIIPQTEYFFVNGYAAEGNLLEIEVTAGT